MLENKFVRTLLCFFLWFTRCSTHGLVHGSTHGIRSWFYLQFLHMVLRMVSSLGSTHGTRSWFYLSFFLWFCSWFNFCSLFMVLLIVSSYGSTHGIRSWFTRSFFSYGVLCSWSLYLCLLMVPTDGFRRWS